MGCALGFFHQTHSGTPMAFHEVIRRLLWVRDATTLRRPISNAPSAVSSGAASGRSDRESVELRWKCGLATSESVCVASHVQASWTDSRDYQARMTRGEPPRVACRRAPVSWRLAFGARVVLPNGTRSDAVLNATGDNCQLGEYASEHRLRTRKALLYGAVYTLCTHVSRAT